MIRIICSKCKNAYLKNEGEKFVCPSCGVEHPISQENLLCAVQYYNEGNFSEANNCLMKHIVKNGADPCAIFYKALCDGFNFDEDTTSLEDVYTKMAEALSDISDDLFVQYLALANDETEKLEKLIAEKHIRLFEGADAEKIKNEVSILISLQDNARKFREKLTEFADAYNERAEEKIIVNFSKCFFVEPALATEVGVLKFQRIAESISSHTVFTGILSTDIKNLEIYYRCIVMFFERNRQKYDFLMESAGKFTELATLLEEGNYNAIKGVPTIGEKLKGAAYDFFQESLKDHDDEFPQQTETVVVIAPETVEVEEIADTEADEEADDSVKADENTEYVDIYSSSDMEIISEDEQINEAEDVIDIDSEVTTEETENDDDVIIEIPVVADEETEASEEAEEATEAEKPEDSIEETEAEEQPAEAEEVTEAPEEVIEEETAETSKDSVEIYAEETQEDTVAEITDEPAEDKTKIIEIVSEEATEEPEKTNSVENLQAIAVADEIDDIGDGFGDEETAEEAEEAITVTPEEEIKEEPRKRTKHKKSYGPFVIIFLIIAVIACVIAIKVVPEKLNANNYEKAASLYDQKKYVQAAEIYGELGDYEDSEIRKSICLYAEATSLESQKKYAEAAEIYAGLGDYEDSAAKLKSCQYHAAVAVLEAGNYAEAKTMLEALNGYADSKNLLSECTYKEGVALLNKKDYQGAIDIFTKLGTYSDSAAKINEAKYGFVKDNLDAKNETTLTFLNDLAKAKYKDSVDIRNKLLGTKNELAEGVTSCINYTTTDAATHLSEVENSKKIYFHVTVNDAKLYNKKLSIKYLTSLGYEDGKDIVLTADENTYAFEYPSTPSKDYTIEFKLLDDNNSVLTSQKITVK